ncbi:hypothetical protein ACHAXH_008253 [Discostella pseudostelligera]
MRLLPRLLCLLLLSTSAIVNALHADEAGLTDFVLKSAGHGDVGVRYAATVDKVWVTSQSNEYPGAIIDLENDSIGSSIRHYYDRHCSIAGRNVTTGAVLWRVNACGGDYDTIHDNYGGFVPRHATLVTPMQSSQQQQQKSSIFSLDNSGILRKWSPASGALLLDVDILSSNDDTNNSNRLHFSDSVPRLLDGTLVIGTVLTTATPSSGNAKTGGVVDDDELLLLLDITGGHPIKEEGTVKSSSSSGTSMVLSAKNLLEKAGVRAPKSNGRNSGSTSSSPRARIIDMHHMEHSDGNRIALWVGWSTSDGTRQDISTITSMAVIEVVLTKDPSGRMAVYRIDRALPLTTTASVGVGSLSAVGSTPLLLSSLQLVHHRSTTDTTLSLLAISSTKQQLLLANIEMPACQMKTGQIVGIDALHPYWRSIDSIRVDATSSSAAGGDYHTIRVAGMDDRYPTLPRRLESSFLLNGGLSTSSAADGDDGGYNALHRVHGPGKRDEEIHQDALAYCADMGTVIAASIDDKEHTMIASSFRLKAKELHERKTWTPNEDGKVVIVPKSGGGKVHSPEGLVRGAHLVECSKNGMTVVFTALGGLTTAVHYEMDDDMKESSAMQLWSSEEGLGSITSAIFLDEAHATPLNGILYADDEEEKALLDLRFSNRIRSQLQSMKSFVFSGGALSSLASLALLSDEKKAERAAAFGFAKISVLLSERLHRVMALDTANKGRIAWSMNLHPRASWHKLVHGGQFVTLNDPHGNGGVHDHEMLALSYVAGGGGSDGSSSILEWKCFDGISGRIFSDEVVSVSSYVMQIVPLRTLTHHPHDVRSCRQVALLIHSDDSVSVVPDSARALTTVEEAMSVADGLFVHTIDKTSGKLRALRVSRKLGAELLPGSNPFELITVGTTIFDPSQEQIVNVAYPRRGEVIQSPSTVLGDDALLLKYLNPHIMVVVTEATKAFLSSVAPVVEGGDETGDGFYNVLAGGQDSSTTFGQKRKPLGATKPGVDTTSPPPKSPIATPSLFISLVDSVSGQILHRVSHAHALDSDIEDGVTTTRVPVVISENWIVYTFFNQRTRRTDVGVITLHEGMIDKNGITAFSSPEQEITFSSLESAKPIVLSKTFGLSKAVTALGATTTRAGISSKQFLFATANDQVIFIDRRLLDPRRPSGALKESEKMEGLLRYEPLLPISPLRTPSHVHEVASVKSIASASANVESQSLVLAFGGPDIFFTRLAPSKGFDLLPDDFNRGMLTVVLVGLIVLLNVIQWMNKKKVVSTIWA